MDSNNSQSLYLWYVLEKDDLNGATSLKQSQNLWMVLKRERKLEILDQGEGKGKTKSKYKDKVWPTTKGKKANMCKPKPQKEGAFSKNYLLNLEELRKNKGRASTFDIFLLEVNLSMLISWVLYNECISLICLDVQGRWNIRVLTKDKADLRVEIEKRLLPQR